MASTSTVFLLTVYLCTALQCTGVSGGAGITVEGGISLDGEICPGLTNVTCDTVNVPLLQWRYIDATNTGGTNIWTYTITDPVNEILQLAVNPAFESVVLLSKSVNEQDSQLFNFTSVLTVNTSQLKEQGISEIQCGDSVEFAVERVNVTIIEQTQPPAPVITEVEAVYQNALLERIMVSWQKVPVQCPVFEESLFYDISLSEGGQKTLNTTVPQTERKDVCSVTLVVPTTTVSALYEVTVSAFNDFGSSPSLPQNIAGQSGGYLSLSVSFMNCITTVECVSRVAGDCSLQYGSHDQLQSDGVRIESNRTRGELLLDPDTTFNFLATVTINSALRVTEQINFTTGAFSPLLSESNIGLIAAGVLLLFLGGAFLVVTFVCFCKQKASASRGWKISLTIGLTVVSLLLVVSVALWIAVGAVVGPQNDTCDLEWQQIRDALVISAMVLSCLVFVTGLAVMIPACYLYHITKSFSPAHSKEAVDAPAPSYYQRGKNWLGQLFFGGTETSSQSARSNGRRANTQPASPNSTRTWWGWIRSKWPWSRNDSEFHEYDNVCYDSKKGTQQKAKYDPTPGYDHLDRSTKRRTGEKVEIQMEEKKSKQAKSPDKKDNKHVPRSDEQSSNGCSVQ